MLKKLLGALQLQRTDDRFTYTVVVIDNDAKSSARPVVAEFETSSQMKVTYACEPRQNIALARNKALQCATGNFISFIDDDEFPEADWLLMMLRTCEETEAAGVLGPVRPYFEAPPPPWIIQGRFCERPEHPTGWVMDWRECRTGNVLFRKEILRGSIDAFNPKFGTGGEDKEFFMRMTQEGHVFRWCNEAVTYETVPEARWKRTYFLKRAMLRGRNSLKIPTGRTDLLVRSLFALPAYLLILPFTLPFGQHVFMKYCIKFCDHAGRLLALLRLNPVRER
jgi:cellulose synthase/poly-beta-1,6-N-acetylglucosamine synthase-like glycosyltransferase